MSEPSNWKKVTSTLPWLPAYLWQRASRRQPASRPLDLIIAVADHFEPMNRAEGVNEIVPLAEQERRLINWCSKYPSAVDPWRDAEGYPFRHTYFYPAENYSEVLIDRLAEHCHSGWGEIEIHLHHGIEAPDTKENTKQTIVEFRDMLAARGFLSQDGESSNPRYAFVHGNWALANSDHGRYCGVDEEMQILADTGCYADVTMPSASSAQISKINSLYECALPLNERAPHRRGRDLSADNSPKTFPLILQGPLTLDFGRRRHGRPSPAIESGELSGVNPPTLRRLANWKNVGISVSGRPDWIFIKLHCHGMQERDEAAMFGTSIRGFLRDLVEGPANTTDYRLHFVTVREMANIALAACDGHKGSPGEYRDYRFRLLESAISQKVGSAHVSRNNIS